MSVIERVAQAIDKAPEFRARRNKLNAYHSQYEVFLADPILTSGDAVSRFASWGEAYADARKRTSQSRARAAVAAMTEPTKAMIDAAEAHDNPGTEDEDGHMVDVEPCPHDKAWWLMVEAILKETP